MCGITGLIHQGKQIVSKELLQQMNEMVAHRGPNGEGAFFADNLALGHRRLSIIDLSDAGHQPMTYQERYTITYNGEVYNYIELRQELMGLGYSFHSESDTEVMLAAYAAWGPECVHKFNGMWAFAIYDAKEKTIFCSRDRFGVKPFYYGTVGDYFAFGSEIKQFTVLPAWQAKLNVNIAYDFLMKSRVNHSNETFFQGIAQLSGGHSLIYDLRQHSYQIQQWYDLTKVKKQKFGFEEAKAQFLKYFQDSLKLRLRSDVKVGSCLSGGMDSSSIVCLIHQMFQNAGIHDQQETVSSCFEIKRFDEQEYIDEVVAATGVEAHKVFLKFDELFPLLDEVIWHQDQPFGSTSILAQWEVYRAAKENGLTVMLDGQGADEYITGYHSFYQVYFKGLLQRGRLLKLWREFKAYRRLHHYSWSVLMGVILSLRCFRFLKPVLKKRLSKIGALPDWWKNSATQGVNTAIIDREIVGIQNHSLMALLYTSLPSLLHYQDRDSMAHSVESREPFLDYRLVEFVLGLPDDYKIHAGKTKYILREAMQGIVPQKVLNRHDKMGFVTPESVWFKENRAIFAEELKQAALALQKYIAVDQLLADFNSALQNSNFAIGSIYWRLICLGRYLKVFQVQVT